MLELTVREGDREILLQFEHSLVAVSKWESKHRKPFLSKLPHTGEEMIDYFGCMLLDPEIDPTMVFRLSAADLKAVKDYIDTPQTASTVPNRSRKGAGSETPTSELIYYWMVAMKINWEVQYWHLSRLLMLVEVVNFKQQPDKKRSNKEIASDWHTANERQKKLFKTSG